MSHGRRPASSPRKAIPGNRRVRIASSVSDSTIWDLERLTRRASASTALSVAVVSRTLKGSAFAMSARVASFGHRTYGV